MTRHTQWLGAALLAGCFFAAGQAVAAPADDIAKLSGQAQSLLTAKCLGIKPDCQLEVVDKGRCGADAEKLVTSFNDVVRQENAGGDFCQSLLADVNKGVYRQVQAHQENTWWDGFLPDPRKDLPARVLAQQSARLYERPDENSQVVKDNVQWFEAFSVLDSQQVGGETWYRVVEGNVPPKKGDNYREPTDDKWIPGKRAIPWRQALVMYPTSGVNRPATLFFKDRDTLRHLTEMSAAARADEIGRLRGQAEKGQGTGEVLGVERTINSEEQEQSVFCPIIDFYPPPDSPSYGKFDIDGQSASLLEVATRIGGGDEKQDVSHAKIDIVFAMDTTESMQPFVNTVRDAMKNFAASVSGLDIRWGFIGYRDKAQYFDYLVKEYTHATVPADEFAGILGQVNVQKKCVGSREYCSDDYPEAVFQGVNAALKSKQWRPDAVKLIFLIGDAPGRSEDGLTTELLHDMMMPKAGTEELSLYAFLLKHSDLIAKNHKIARYTKEAEAQYTALSSFGSKPAFYPVNGDSEQALHEAFAAAFDQIKNELANLKHADRNTAKSGSVTELIFRQAAIRLANPNLPPDDIRAWVSDKAPEDPAVVAMVPSVVLTRTELEELLHRVDDLIAMGNKALIGEGETPPDFFELVRLNTMWTLKNPQGVEFQERFRMPSGLDRLPYYKSYVMRLSASAFKDRDTLNRMVQNMQMKRDLYNNKLNRFPDPSLWKTLGGADKEEERVVVIRLNELP